MPFPASFPPLPLPPGPLPGAGGDAAATGGGGGGAGGLRAATCVAFILQSRLSLSSHHALLAVACNRQLMPLRVSLPPT